MKITLFEKERTVLIPTGAMMEKWQLAFHCSPFDFLDEAATMKDMKKTKALLADLLSPTVTEQEIASLTLPDMVKAMNAIGEVLTDALGIDEATPSLEKKKAFPSSS